jgi:hypothetical protein
MIHSMRPEDDLNPLSNAKRYGENATALARFLGSGNATS